MRLLLAIWATKVAAAILHVFGRAGTHVPGRIARRIHPGIIGAISHPARVVAVTGTNGKTTATNLLTGALLTQGERVVSNRLGSNLAAGVAASLISAVDWRGRSRVDAAVLEVDERSARLVLPQLAPDLLLCLNLTRDSIKRNAHPAYIAWILESALPASTELVLNADDLIVSGIAPENPRRYFAVDRLPGDGTEPSGAAVDVAVCPDCDARLSWDYWRYNHIGRAVCRSCGFRAPTAQYRVTTIDAAAERIGMALPSGRISAKLVNDNIVNVYNQIAVTAVLDALGVDAVAIAAAFDRLAPPQTRFAEERIGDRRLIRILTKGLVGVACSRAFAYVHSFGGRKSIVLAIDEVTDRHDDVENTCWAYDADYGYLADDSIVQIVVGGVRRHDQALRLAIAGVDPARITLVESELATAELVELADVDAVFTLHSVHNALSTGTPVHERIRGRLTELSSAPR